MNTTLERYGKGFAVRTMRKAMTLSVNDLAQLAGVSSSYLYQVEAGRRRASDACLERITGALAARLGSAS